MPTKLLSAVVWEKMVWMMVLVASCSVGTAWAQTASGQTAGQVMVEPIQDKLPYRVQADQPVLLLLNRMRHPELEGYLEGIVWLDGGLSDTPQPGQLEITLHAASDQRVMARHVVAQPASSRLMISIPMPPDATGQAGRMTVRWLDGEGKERGRSDAPFEIVPSARPANQGVVSIHVPNPDGLHMKRWPVTVGVPFPQGALQDKAHLTLMDEQGNVVPMQVRQTARWSRRGSVKWVLLEGVVDLKGQPRRLQLHYQPEKPVASHEVSARRLKVTPGVWPEVDSDHYWIDAHGLNMVADGHARKVLSREAMFGGYVVHENGKTYTMPRDTPLTVEHVGPEKVTLKAQGWYTYASTGESFCQFVVRYELSQGSPLVRLYHTWIFTGDAYVDRIADIGWRFDLGDGLVPQPFPASYDAEGPVIDADILVQHDDDAYDVVSSAAGDQREAKAGRLPGVMVARGAGVDLRVGVRDFWQNYPAQVQRQSNALIYHLWPSHGRDARREPTPENAMRLWFAHEGKLLDFALPEAYTQPPIINGIPTSRRGSRSYTLEGIYKQRANPQGVAKTTEFWIIATPTSQPVGPSMDWLRSLQDYTLTAVVDPVWIAQSGAMGLMHPRDEANYPVEEAVYLAHALAPKQWQEQTHIYGKWIWGCMPSAPQFEERRIGYHRGLRKSHHGWPYSWTPFARSGDPRLLQLADAGTRYQCDVAFIHYSDAKLNNRPRGWYTRFPIPWANNRPYPQVRTRESKTDYLWLSHYFTGYGRAHDVAIDFKNLIKYSGSGLASPHDDQTLFERVGGDENRSSVEMLQTYINMYEATFDPWFIAAAHQIARVHVETARTIPGGWTGHFEGMGIRVWNEFHGDPEYREQVALPYVRHWGTQHTPSVSTWALVTPMFEPRNLAYELTGQAVDAGVIRGGLDEMILSTFRGEPAYYQGFRAPPGSNNEWGPSYTGYLLRDLPVSLALLERARVEGQVVESIPNDFLQAPAVEQFDKEAGRATMRWAVHFMKRDAEALPLLVRVHGAAKWAKDETASMRVIGPDGKTWLQQEVAGRKLSDQSLPAEAPPGSYTLEVVVSSNVRIGSSAPYRPTLRLPVTPSGTPEVYEAHRDEQGRVHVGASHHTARYWLPRPSLDGMWRVAFKPANLQGLSVVTLGTQERPWLSQHHLVRDKTNRSKPWDLQVPVAELGSSEFLSITQAGVGGGFTLDPMFTHYLALTPARWYSPPGSSPRKQPPEVAPGSSPRKQSRK